MSSFWEEALKMALICKKWSLCHWLLTNAFEVNRNDFTVHVLSWPTYVAGGWSVLYAGRYEWWERREDSCLFFSRYISSERLKEKVRHTVAAFWVQCLYQGHFNRENGHDCCKINQLLVRFWKWLSQPERIRIVLMKFPHFNSTPSKFKQKKLE